LINYFKSYSSLGDDRFFVSPCMKEGRQIRKTRPNVQIYTKTRPNFLLQ